MSTTDERLDRIEASLERVEALLSQAHAAIMPVLENPGRLLGKLMGGGK